MFRIGTLGGFAELAREHHSRMCEARNRLPAQPPNAVLSDEDVNDEFIAYHHQKELVSREIVEAAMITIVFAAIAAEAYIYDYAASHLGDKYVEKHLDKLSLRSKWVVVARIVAGYNIDTDGQAFESLGCLTQFRNEIVHHKTRDGSSLLGTERLADLLKYSSEIDSRADRAILALDSIKAEASKFDRPFGPDQLG